MRAMLLLLSTLAAASTLVACSGSSGSPTPTPAPGTDLAYLKVICRGTDSFLGAVNKATTASAISKVIVEFIANLKAAKPPADLVSFNQAFIKYLEDAVNQPTSLLTKMPPLPPKKPRERLVALESNVNECQGPNFLNTPSTPSPVPSPTTAGH